MQIFANLKKNLSGSTLRLATVFTNNAVILKRYGQFTQKVKGSDYNCGNDLHTRNTAM